MDVRTEVLHGKAAIRARAAELEAFLPGCEDADSLASLNVWMRDAEAQRGVPIATMVYEDHILVAVLLAVELSIAGWRTRLAHAGNMTGHLGYFSPAEAPPVTRQTRILAAADALVRSGCVLGLLMSARQPAMARTEAALLLQASEIAAEATRDVYDTFDLRPDFNGSLAGLGAHTRRNLRYYRRRAESELKTEFYAELTGADLRDAVLDLKDAMPGDLPPGVLKNRIAHVSQRPEAFCMGVRAADGRWLSWVSGWRTGRCTYVDWQCNRAGMPRYSLSTVMRSYLIEQESYRAQLQIRFLGGTPHTMHYGFREETCTDWLFTADNLGGRALGAALRLMAWMRRMIKPSQADGTERAARPRAPRRHRVASLVVRMVGTIIRAEQGT